MRPNTGSLIPHLDTVQMRPFYELEKKIIDHGTQIESWFREVWRKSPPLLTCSADIRNSGFKISVVDTNLFPAGFNNLNPEFYPLCIQAAQSMLMELYPGCKNILIIAESHTRNPYYHQSLATLEDIIHKAGYETRVGQFDIKKPQTLAIAGNNDLTIYPLSKKDNKIVSEDFTPCLVILNNDLSEGIPEVLEGIAQPIEPPPKLGWAFRSKSRHFTFFNEVCQEFANMLDIDVWQICPLFLDCNDIDFMQQEGMECLVEKTQTLLDHIQQKYHQYNIEHAPFVFIKADAGTYGMAVMAVQDAAELKKLNRKQRISMSTRKGGQKVNRVIIQEGIYTFETVGEDSAVAEPVVYMLGHHVIGGFYRVHKGRSRQDNLNSPGMHFERLMFSECCNNPHISGHHPQNQFYVYSVIARLGLLATCREKTAL